MSVAAAIAQINEAHSEGVDGLINCGAVQYLPKFTDSDFDPTSIAKEIAINLTSPAELVVGLLSGMRQRPAAFVLNVNFRARDRAQVGIGHLLRDESWPRQSHSRAARSVC